MRVGLGIGAGEGLDGVAVLRAHDPLGGEQALASDGAARVDAPRGDAHLRPEPEPEPVREARRGVVEHAGRVHALEEQLRGLLGLRHDALWKFRRFDQSRTRRSRG